MKNIVIIATGGTIAGSGDAGKAADYQAGRISVSDILESVPSIRIARSSEDRADVQHRQQRHG